MRFKWQVSKVVSRANYGWKSGVPLSWLAIQWCWYLCQKATGLICTLPECKPKTLGFQTGEFQYVQYRPTPWIISCFQELVFKYEVFEDHYDQLHIMMPLVNCSVGLKCFASSHLWVYLVVARLSSWWGYGWRVHTLCYVLQLEPGAKIPKTACAQSYEMQESQGWYGCAFTEDTGGPEEASPVWTICKGGISGDFIHLWAPLWLLYFAWEPHGPCSCPHLIHECNGTLNWQQVRSLHVTQEKVQFWFAFSSV